MSETVNDGGPAFPTPVCEEPHCESCESKSAGTGIFFGGTQGMTLRDYFAAKALPALLHLWHKDLTASKADPDFCGLCIVDNEGGTPDGIAEEAYAMADAMLRAREAE